MNTPEKITSADTELCHIAARIQRVLEAQARAEREGQHAEVEAGYLALSRLADDAGRVHAAQARANCQAAIDRAAQRGADTGQRSQASIDRVVAALIPGETDEEMAITRTRNIWHVAHAEAIRAEDAFKHIAVERSGDRSNEVLVRYINAMRDLSHALLWMAAAETDVHLAALPPAEAADLQARLESLEILEG